MTLTVNGSGAVDAGIGGIVEGVWKHFLIERFKPYVEAGNTKARSERVNLLVTEVTARLDANAEAIEALVGNVGRSWRASPVTVKWSILEVLATCATRSARLPRAHRVHAQRPGERWPASTRKAGCARGASTSTRLRNCWRTSWRNGASRSGGFPPARRGLVRLLPPRDTRRFHGGVDAVRVGGARPAAPSPDRGNHVRLLKQRRSPTASTTRGNGERVARQAGAKAV